ncbi:MAG TPA: circularly permuted type 2 ATP-grasp protein [Acidimicrobiia bacterium]|nr:circularly permuted type 2 ATP-grasp protein [Acidimicrobiia bacterium]
MFDAEGETRVDYRTLYEHVQTLSRLDFDERCATRDRAFRDQGITYAFSGEERPFPLDLVPRLISASEWSLIERGVAQRVRALERFLDDVYGSGEIMRAGVIPRRLVVTSSHFHRSAFGISPPGGVRVHVAGIDLVRDADGSMCVLEDNLRIPSGISYVVENRRAMTHVFPELFAAHRVQPVSDYPSRLLQTLCAAAPQGVDDPHVVLLTPGVHNAAYFEHSFLARQMGVELVEGRDLICRDNVVYMLTTSGEERVDVVYRRVDDEFLDPLHFLPTSMLGCAGIVNAARAGNVTIANFLGNGVADDKAVYPHVPAMIDFYLGERPLLSNVETFPLDDVEVRSWALARIDELVWKPADGSGGRGIVIGPRADDSALESVRASVEADPRSWIAQRPVALSTAPTYVQSGMRPRHLDLRPFALNDGENVWVVPGGLTRVALCEGSLVVNSSQGGGSKDTWVLAPDGAEVDGDAMTVPAVEECEPLARQPFDMVPASGQQAAQQQ